MQIGINLTRIIQIRFLCSQRPFLWLCHSMFVQFDRTGRRRLKPYVILFNTESIQYPANYSVNCSPQTTNYKTSSQTAPHSSKLQHTTVKCQIHHVHNKGMGQDIQGLWLWGKRCAEDSNLLFETLIREAKKTLNL